MKKSVAIVAIVVLLAAGVAFVGYQQGWIAPPELVLELRATAPDGEPLSGVVVEAFGGTVGETDAEGTLIVPFHRGVGEEFTVSAALARPGFEFSPWEEGVVVRKWDRDAPETLRYVLEATLEPVSISASIRVEDEGAPLAGAAVSLDGKSLGTTDESGTVTVDLGDQISRSGRVSVSRKGYTRYRETVDLRGESTLDVALSKIGTIYGSLSATYESMGRLVPLAGADVALGGKTVGTTDNSGSLRLALPSRSTQVEVIKDGFLPDPATTSVSTSTRRVNVTLYPREAPVYRLTVLPPMNGKPGDRDVESALDEVEDRLSDYLFSYACFRRVDSGRFLEAAEAANLSQEQLLSDGWESKPSLAALADVVVATEVTNDNRIFVSVQVVAASGERLGAFVESDKRSKVRSISENASEKILQIFPFEGHVLSVADNNIQASLNSGQDRGLRKGNRVTFYKLSSVSPTSLTAVGRGKIKSINSEGSVIEPEGDLAELSVGDKLVVASRNREAAFNASLGLTVMAGREGSEQPFADVNVYRDGTWVGISSDSGELDVPVASGDKHEFLFVRTGIAPHKEDIKTDGRRGNQMVILPHSMARLRLESNPSGAQVTIDGRLLGITPLDTDVPLGFRRVQLEAGDEWRRFDKVLELTNIEENYTGSRRIDLERDVLKHAERLLANDDVSGAVRVLSDVPTSHTDFSAAHNRLGGIYLDVTKEPQKAVREFEKVMSRPENAQLVDKRFAVTYLNLGRAYYLTETTDGAEKAIRPLLKALENKRFFPRNEYDRASHDTLYFLALASHKLYYASPSDRLLNDTARRWRDYFDFFPDELRGDPDVEQARAGAQHYYDEIQRQLGDN